MDSIHSKNKIKKEIIILDLVCLNLIQIILCVTIFLLMTSCAVEPEDWTKVKPPPQTLGLERAGFFNIGDSLYSQHCDPKGNQIWMRWDENKELWKKVKYNTLGCRDGESATGPDSS